MMSLKNYKKYDPYIDDYMYKVLDEKIRTNKDIKKAMTFIQDKLDQDNVIIKHDIIERSIELTQKYFFKLLPWQKFFYAFVFGVFYEDNSLVFNEYLLYMGRGAGKNGLFAAIAFCLVYLSPIKNYDITIVATSEKQAKTSFMEIWELLEANKKRFRKHFRWTKEIIVCKKNNSKISFSTSNPKTADGGRPGAVGFDEIHAYEDEEQIKVHTSGLGKKANPRRFYLTTDGNQRDGFLDMLKLESELILNGDRPNRRMLPLLYRLDNLKQMNDSKNWVMANPSVDDFRSLMDEMKQEFEKLEDRPSAKLEFMTKRMNLPTQDAYNAVAEWEQILATNQDMVDIRGRECIGAIDYSDTDDFTGVGLMFKYEDKTYWKHHTFINHKSIQRYNFKVPIDLAIEQGLVTVLYTETNKPEDILNWFICQTRDYGVRIKLIASDLYRISYLEGKAKEMGLPQLKIARSGTKTHTKLQPIIEDLFAYKNLVYGDDLMMRWYTNNVYIKRDNKGNIAYEKIEPKRRKTDGFMAFLHALQFQDELQIEKKTTYNKRLKTYTY